MRSIADGRQIHRENLALYRRFLERDIGRLEGAARAEAQADSLTQTEAERRGGRALLLSEAARQRDRLAECHTALASLGVKS